MQVDQLTRREFGALLNLMSNANKFTDRSTITINAHHGEDCYHKSYDGAPTDGNCSVRVVRGGQPQHCKGPRPHFPLPLLGRADESSSKSDDFAAAAHDRLWH
jgi:hypothetical protein